jgi:hypothetical protein
MGACCSSKSQDFISDQELFIQSILSSLLVSKQDGKMLQEKFQECIESIILDKLSNKKIVFISKYKLQTFNQNYFYDNENSENIFLEYHKNLAPTYEELIKESAFHYNFIKHCISLFQFYEKHEIIYQCLKEYSPDKIVTFSIFEDFLGKYLKLNLIIFTDKINDLLYSVKENKIIDNYSIDTDFRKKCKELLDNIYNESNVDNFKNYLLDDLKDIIHIKRDETNINKISISLNNLNDFALHNPYLFISLELRRYFYHKYSISPSNRISSL